MCGIVGYIGKRDCVELLMDGLRRLEYRGYDSAGLAIMQNGKADVVRSLGKLNHLAEALKETSLAGTTGIGHTRWATHGRPSEENAHPHKAGKVTVVHNGIIENHLQLKNELTGQGRTFTSETDTEIFAHLIDRQLTGDTEPLKALQGALAKVKGAWALAVLVDDHPDLILCAKNGSPLILGVGDGEGYVGSDIPALLPHTKEMIFLEEGDVAAVTAGAVKVFDALAKPVTRRVKSIPWSPAMAEKEGFKHFMLKEIYEQPRAVADTLRGRVSLEQADVFLDGFDVDANAVRKVFLIACGTSYHAALVGKFLVEGLARIPTEVDLASEFRYRDPLAGPDDLLVAISQSGETADTVAAVREAKEKKSKIMAVANVVGSQIPRLSDSAVYTHAGPEIGVASTKAFTTQLAVLAGLAVHLAKRKGTMSEDRIRELLEALLAVPAQMHHVIQQAAQINVIARRYAHARDFLYLGRGINYPIALEGALKLKEISYIHAEGYPAGEMKHGPIALIDEELPVVVITPRGPAYEKTLNNLEEVRTRQGKVIAIATQGDDLIGGLADDLFLIPDVVDWLQPLLTVLPLQLLAYHVADRKGTDVDQPRNLAKSVTVE